MSDQTRGVSPSNLRISLETGTRSCELVGNLEGTLEGTLGVLSAAYPID